MSGGSGGVMHWAPPAPSLASLPVDQSKTEPKPAYYKLQFGDDYTGFSYYVRTLAVMIGRNCEKPSQPPPPAIPDPSVPSIPPLDEAPGGQEVDGQVKEEEEGDGPKAEGSVEEGMEGVQVGDVTVKMESAPTEDPITMYLQGIESAQSEVEEAIAEPIPATISEVDAAKASEETPPLGDTALVDVELLVKPEGEVVDGPPPPPPPPPPPRKSGPAEHVDVDLGPLKSVSRNHAKIEYRSDLGHFCLEIYGRNGAWVDDRYYVKGSTVPLNQGSHIQIATRIFSFVLPPSPGGSPYDSSYESAAFEDLPYPYNLPPSQVGYAEFYGEGGPGPSSASAIAARAAAAAAAVLPEAPAIRPFNAFAAPDGHGLGIEMDERWLRDWNGSDGSGLGSSDDADSFDSSSDNDSDEDSEEEDEEEDDDEDDEDEDEDDEEDDEEDSASEDERPQKRGPPRIKLTVRRKQPPSLDIDGEEEISSSQDEEEGESEPEEESQRGKKGAPTKRPAKKTKKAVALATAAARKAAAAEAASKKTAGKAPSKADGKAKGRKGRVEESESEAATSVKGETPTKGKKTIAKKEPKKNAKIAPADSVTSVDSAPAVKVESAPQTINELLAKAPPPNTQPPPRVAPAPAPQPRPMQPTPIPRPVASASQNSNTASPEPPRPFFLTELIETPGRPGHIIVNVPIPPSGAGPRPPPGPLIGLDGNHFIGPPPVKPICTFATIIYTALSNLPRGRGTLGEVCNWVAGEWEWFRLNVDAGWQNSIRHNLSLNKAFLKVPRIPEDDPESKGSVWVIDPEEGPLFEERQRKDPGKIGDKIKTAEKRERDRQKVEERIKKQREAAAEAHAAQRALPTPPQPAHPVQPAPTLRPIAPGHPPAATPAAPRPIPQRAQPPIPPKAVLAPKTKITVTVTPLTPALRAKTIIASTDAAGNPMPFVCDGQALYLDPASFGHLTDELISKLSTLGASGAVDVLSGWLSNKNKLKATHAKNAAAAAAANAAKGGPVRPVNGAAGAAAAARIAAARPGAAGKPAVPTSAKPGAPAARPPAAAGTAGTPVRPPAASSAAAGGAKPAPAGPGAKPATTAASGSAPKKVIGPAPPGASLITIISMIADAANAGGDVNIVGPHASTLLRYIRLTGAAVEMPMVEKIWQTGIMPPIPPKKVAPGAKPASGAAAKVNGVNGIAKPGAAASAVRPPAAAVVAKPNGQAAPVPVAPATATKPAAAPATPAAPGGVVNGVKRKAEEEVAAPTPADAEAKKAKLDSAPAPTAVS